MLEMSRDEIDALLCDSRIGRLSMADPADGRPYAIPLPFCWAEGALYVRLGERITTNQAQHVGAFVERGGGLVRRRDRRRTRNRPTR